MSTPVKTTGCWLMRKRERDYNGREKKTGKYFRLFVDSVDAKVNIHNPEWNFIRRVEYGFNIGRVRIKKNFKFFVRLTSLPAPTSSVKV
jgi:hypothetical protein